MKVKQFFRIPLVMLTTVVLTLGIAGLYYFIAVGNDIRKLGFENEVIDAKKALLLTIVTFGLYGIYYIYKLGRILERTHDHKLPITHLVVMFSIFLGFAVYNYSIGMSILAIVILWIVASFNLWVVYYQRILNEELEISLANLRHNLYILIASIILIIIAIRKFHAAIM